VSGEQAPSGLDLDRLVDNFDVFDHETAQHVFEVTGHARSRCPVSHSSAYGGYWLVTSYAEVRQALSDPATYSSSRGVGFPHHQTLMMPPIDLDPPLQKDFRRLLNPHFSRAGIAKYAGAIREIAATTVDAFAGRARADQHGADLHNDFAAPFTAEVLARVILHVDDEDLFQRARAVASQISRHDPSQEGDKRAQLEQISEEILEQRAASGARHGDCIDALLYGEVSGRRLTRDERVGTLMILVLGGLSTTNAALTGIFRHVAQTPGLEEHLRDDDWTRTELDEFLRFEPPVGSLSRTVMKDTVLGTQPLKADEVVLLHFAAANRDAAVFAEPDELRLDRGKNPHLAFGLGDHRCIGSNLARMQIEIGVAELLARVENIRLADGAVLEREAGTGSGWISLPVTFRPR
jgi:cytochrome P450